jgi:general secretion pathway protein G
MENGKRIIHGQRGFSLIEIMIVLTLIAVAGTFVVGQLINKLDEGNYSAATTQVRNLKTMLEEYRRYCGVYPTNEQNLDALVAKPSSPPDCPNYPTGGIINGKLPADPWGHPYVYDSPDNGKSYLITSYGKDGAENGEGFDKDIKSNDL